MKKRYPETIGGRDIDISQIGFRLRNSLRELFPINEVPVSLKERADELVAMLVSAEQGIESFIDAVRDVEGSFLE